MTDIIECPDCDAKGIIDISDYDGHKGGLIGTYQTKKCERCDGTGILEQITTITFKPYHRKVRS